MTHIEPLILLFSEIHATDLPLVGGKGANLGEMAAAGFPVPPGFCLTTAAFRRFLAASPEAEHIYALLDSLTPGDLEAVRRVGAQVRQTLLQVPIPAEVAQAALEAWRVIGPEVAYAVRSSATAEDLPGASFAGQQETYLNVRGESALLDAIRRCWVSLFTDRAILYRMEQGFSHRDVALSVVVQQMVMAEKSGILFTADPVNGHRHTLIINASFGLGEALVSGLVTPDTYRVDKRTHRIVAREIADKEIAIRPLRDGGTRQEPLPLDLRHQPALSDAQILALADLGIRIEAHYGQPQDIEWAIVTPPLKEEGGIAPSPQWREGRGGGQIYILQSRPITALYPVQDLESPDGSLRVYFSVGHQQGATRDMAPLSLSTFLLLLPLARTPDGFGSSYLRTSGGRMYVDLTPLLRHPLARHLVFALTSQFDVLAPQMLKAAMQRPEFRRAQPVRLNAAFLRFALRILRRVLAALWRRELSGFVQRTNALMDDFVAGVRQKLHAAAPGKERLQAVREILPNIAPFLLNWVPEAAAGIAATRILPRLARRYLTVEETEALTLGIPGNVVNEMNLAIGDLADLARQTPELVAWFDHLGDDAHAWLARATQIEGSAPFIAAWEDFLARYGARCPAEIDIRMPRWYEDPLPLLQVIAGHLQGEAGRHRKQWDAFAQARHATFQHLMQKADRGPLGGLRRRLFQRLYYVVTQVGGMREHHKFLAVRVLWEIKQALKATAEVLVQQGKLAQLDDIWFLEWRDLFAIWDDMTTDWSALVARRRADTERYQRLAPPVIITSDGETPVVHYRVEDAPPGALPGNPVSAGVVEGVAHVIHDPQRETLAPSEILVAQFTDPGWTPLFINAAGLALEVGGSLTHGAVVAREYGIPAVVGVRNATRKIRTGQRIRVDGNRGVVEIL